MAIVENETLFVQFPPWDSTQLSRFASDMKKIIKDGVVQRVIRRCKDEVISIGDEILIPVSKSYLQEDIQTFKILLISKQI